jgi:hypothetical protein
MPDDLTMLTVNLVPEAYAALGRAADREGCSRTDVVNRALLAYDRDPGLMAWFRLRIGRRPR